MVDRLGYAYPPGRPGDAAEWVLDGVSLAVEAGESVAVMGATGAGKTTLCLALNGIVPRSTGGTIRGSVVVDGLDTRREPVARLAARVGLVFQDVETQLFSMTVRAEIAFGLESLGVDPAEMVERIDWAASLVGVGGLLDRSPFQLSGGQKQRVAIAAVLAMTPRVLVLDEPTASLDPAGKHEVLDALRGLRREHRTTIVMAEQESEHVAAFADRVLVLEAGRVALEGEPGEVLADVERLRRAGLAAPQMSEVAHRLNRALGTRHAFDDVEAACAALAPALRGRPDPGR